MALRRVASLCKEMNLQGKANERKVVVLAKCGICKERKMQGKINLNLQGKGIARNGIWREMESVRNGFCEFSAPAAKCSWGLISLSLRSTGHSARMWIE